MNKSSIHDIDNAVETNCSASSDDIRIHLNDFVKFKLTDVGAEIFRHQYDEANDWINKHRGTPIPASEPEYDSEGYTRMKLWEFMSLFGKHIGILKPDVVDPLEIIYEKEMQC